MLVKNFLLLSALAVAVVSAADKPTSLRHKKADRGLKKEKNNKNNNNNNNNNGDNKAIAKQLYSFNYPDFTATPPLERTFTKNSGYIPQVGYTSEAGRVIPLGMSTTENLGQLDLIEINKTPGGEETVELNRAAVNEACAQDATCCNFNSECESGCCAGWVYGCVEEGTAAYTATC